MFTVRVRFCVRAMSRRSEPYAAFLDFWIADLVLALSAPCLDVDAQVRRQQTLEFGASLFRAAMDVGRVALVPRSVQSAPCVDGTPLDASWLAARVIPYLKDPVLDVCTEDLVHIDEMWSRIDNGWSSGLAPTQAVRGLQDHPEIMEWLQQNAGTG